MERLLTRDLDLYAVSDSEGLGMQPRNFLTSFLECCCLSKEPQFENHWSGVEVMNRVWANNLYLKARELMKDL